MSDLLELTDEKGRWRARDVAYMTGSHRTLRAHIPEFELKPFQLDAGPENPHLQTVVRKTLRPTEHPMPVGVVSKSYSLVQHREVVDLCVKALTEAKLDPTGLKCEVGLTPLGEYMVFRVYMPSDHGFTAKDHNPMALRVECINSVDGSHRLVVFYSWLRLVCLNGMMIRQTKTEAREIHNDRLDLKVVHEGIVRGLAVAAEDVRFLKEWEETNLDWTKFEGWINQDLTKAWGKKAASRVYWISLEGYDSKFADPFEPGDATAKECVKLERVPGAASPAETFYDILQALTWIATQRTNVEERLEWQAQIPGLMESLKKKAQAVKPFEARNLFNV